MKLRTFFTDTLWVGIVLPLVVLIMMAWAALPAALAQPGKAPAEWIKLSAGGKFDLMAPPGSAYVPRRGIDSSVGRIETPGFALQFDYGAYSGRIRPGPEYQQYKVRQVEIDGKAATIVTAFVPARAADRPYLIAIHFPNLGRSAIGPVRLTMAALVATPKAYNTIETVFRTITFK